MSNEQEVLIQKIQKICDVYHPEFLLSVPENLHTQTMWDRLMEKDWPAFAYFVPRKFRTLKMSTDIHFDVGRDPYMFRFVPFKFMNQEMCNDAVFSYPEYLAMIPDEFRTFELCCDVLSEDPRLFVNVPYSVMTQEMCNDVVERIPEMFCLVPEEFLTQEMCNDAVSRDPDMFRYVPEEFKTSKLYDCLTEIGDEKVEFKTNSQCCICLELKEKIFRFKYCKGDHEGFCKECSIQIFSCPMTCNKTSMPGRVRA